MLKDKVTKVARYGFKNVNELLSGLTRPIRLCSLGIVCFASLNTKPERLVDDSFPSHVVYLQISIKNARRPI